MSWENLNQFAHKIFIIELRKSKPIQPSNYYNQTDIQYDHQQIQIVPIFTNIEKSLDKSEAIWRQIIQIGCLLDFIPKSVMVRAIQSSLTLAKPSAANLWNVNVNFKADCATLQHLNLHWTFWGIFWIVLLSVVFYHSVPQ